MTQVRTAWNKNILFNLFTDFNDTFESSFIVAFIKDIRRRQCHYEFNAVF